MRRATVRRLAWSHTVGTGANRALLVGVAIHNAGRRITNATYAGQSLNLMGESVDAGGKVRVMLYQMMGPPVGTGLVSLALDGSDRISGGSMSFTGVAQGASNGGFTGANGIAGNPSVTISSGAGELVFDVVGSPGDALSYTAGPLQNRRWMRATGTGAGDAISAGSIQFGAPIVTNFWTQGAASGWALGAISLKPAPPLSLQADVQSRVTGPSNVVAGLNFNYFITVTNAGLATATNVVLSNSVPFGSIFVSASGGGTFENGAVTWPGFNLPGGAVANFTLTLTAPSRGVLTNVIRSRAATYDPESSNNDGSSPEASALTTVIPYDASPAGSSCALTTNGITSTWSQTVGSGYNRMLLVGISLRQKASVVSGVTYGGLPLTNLVSSRIKNGVEIWGMVAPPVGTANIVINWNGASDMVGWSGIFTNVDQLNPVSATGSASDSSTIPSVGIVSASGDLVVDTVSTTGDAVSMTASGWQAEICHNRIGTGGSNGRGAASYASGGISTNMGWTMTASKNWDMVAVVLKAGPPLPQADVASLVSGPAEVSAYQRWFTRSWRQTLVPPRRAMWL